MASSYPLQSRVGDYDIWSEPLDDLLPTPSNSCLRGFRTPTIRPNIHCAWQRGAFPESKPQHLLEVEWLFFGLIAEFFQEDVSKTLLQQVRTHAGIEINTQEFLDKLSRWHRQFDGFSKEEQNDRLDAIESTLRVAANEADSLDEINPTAAVVAGSAESLLLVKLMIEYFSSVCAALRYESSKSVLSKIHPRKQWFHKSAKIAFNADQERSTYAGGDRRHEPQNYFHALLSQHENPSTHTGTLLLEMMLHNKWCPTVARSICQSYDYTTTYYLSRILRTEAHEGLNHRHCSQDKRCKAYDMSKEELEAYAPEHVGNCPGCEMLPRPVDYKTYEQGLKDAIEEGKIPILSIKTKSLRMRIDKYDRSQRFTALSHIWSDGMGNDISNALPKCQLGRIVHRLLRVQQERRAALGWYEFIYGGHFLEYLWDFVQGESRLYFWMDTLCLPARGLDTGQIMGSNDSEGQPAIQQRVLRAAVNDLRRRRQKLIIDYYSDEERKEARQIQERRKSLTRQKIETKRELPGTLNILDDRKSLRRSAISLITPIFQAAEQVVVFDTGLEYGLEADCKGSSTQFQEDAIASRLLGSKWVLRGWTYQEGSLARTCYFETGQTKLAKLQNLLGKERKIWLPGRIYDRKERSETIGGQFATLVKILRCLRLVEAKDQASSCISQFLIPLKSIHAATLNDIRKVAVRSGRRSQDVREHRNAIADRVVEYHNHLLYRSTSWASDLSNIIGHLLDYDPEEVQSLRPEDRLPTIVRSCEKLPISLLFNTQKKIEPNTAPWNSWIPTVIEGDELIPGSTLAKSAALRFPQRKGRRLEHRVAHTRTSPALIKSDLTLEQSVKAQEQLLLLCVRDPSYDTLESPYKFVEDESGNRYRIELFLGAKRLRSQVPFPNDEDSECIEPLKKHYEEFTEKAECVFRGNDTLYIIDAFSMTSQGRSGRGARMIVVQDDSNKMQLRFDCPITVQKYTVHGPELPLRPNNSTSNYRQFLRGLTIPQGTTQIAILFDGIAEDHKLSTIPLRSPPARHPAARAVIPAVFLATFAMIAANAACFSKSCGVFAFVGMSTGWLAAIAALSLSLFYGTRAFDRQNTNKWVQRYTVKNKKKKEEQGLQQQQGSLQKLFASRRRKGTCSALEGQWEQE